MWSTSARRLTSFSRCFEMVFDDLVQNESYGEPSLIGEGLQLLKVLGFDAERMPLLASLFHGPSFLNHQTQYIRTSTIFKRNAVLCLTMLDYAV